MGDQQNNRILRVFGILDENPLADVISSFRDESFRFSYKRSRLGTRGHTGNC